jgi:pimeloyl-ACP methyl ester carboxylesterase
MRITEHRIPGLVLVDHRFDVPLDHQRPSGNTISLFARELASVATERSNLPWLLFLQGGPGSGAPRPDGASGWIKAALPHYRVLLLDQRGAGRSSPILAQTLAHLSDAQAQADYLKLFRADAIVRDAELIRADFLGGEPWSVLGQSYGGFCAVHYLSAAPAGLREVFVTGGLPPLAASADDIYRATYRRVLEKNDSFFRRYPDDARQARQIADYLAEHDVTLPGGDRLSPRRFQQLGIYFGDSAGFEVVHYLLEEAFVAGPHGPELSYPFLRHFENAFAFDTNPIYALLQEACYAQEEATNWSAERVRDEFPQFDPGAGARLSFTGEMIYPWMFEEYGALRPLKEAAEILAAYDGWPRIYDPAALARNRVPVAAAVYANDMYVERVYSEATAGAIAGLRLWLTNEHEHSALRRYGEAVFGRLLAMVRGEL